LGIRLSGLELGVSSFAFRGSGFGYRVQITGFHVSGSRMRAQGCEVRVVNLLGMAQVSDSGYRVSGFRSRDEGSGLRGAGSGLRGKA